MMSEQKCNQEFGMGDCINKSKPSKEGCSEPHVTLMKDKKTICRVACLGLPSQMPAVWDITTIVREEKIDSLSGLPVFYLCPACEDFHQEREWRAFLDFLQKYKKVAISKLGFCEVYILPPSNKNSECLVKVVYKGTVPNVSPSHKRSGLDTSAAEVSSLRRFRAGISMPGNSLGLSKSFERNYVTAHPSYLKTLGQAHSSWIFGAIAELVDNSRDAEATKLEVAISMIYSKTAGKDIPMLTIIDDGHGMSHSDMQRMISFGHRQPEVDDPDHIGRFGIGFKTGAMRLGKDALVLTQTATSRSIAFLSQTLNEKKDNLEIPIVSYRRIGQYMEVDSCVQNEDSAKYNLKIIKKFSPFDKYLIGEKAGLFSENKTGTQIFIWNLDEWGSTYSLQWEDGMSGGSSFHHGGIYIRSRRIRSRPGQMSHTVPLDYSLKSYLEVIFLYPRMKIYVQGALVKSQPLEKTLHKTIVENGIVLGKPVQLTLGRSQLEWEQANCGIFLYWHGRLIEDDNNDVWVHNSKQGFQDCEAYAELEKWLGEKTDGYLDKNVDKIQVKKGNAQYKPDHEWVQCDKCRKWRMLNSDFDSKTLPFEWFCYMKPFNGKCEVLEEKSGSGVITISANRYGYSSKCPTEFRNGHPEKAADKSGDTDDSHSEFKENVQISLKRHRTCTPRSSKKN